MRPRGFRNENLGNLCHQIQKMGDYRPNRDIFPETEEELKEFIRNLKKAAIKNKTKGVKDGRIFSCQLVE
ncbi:MAG: hypothetical protein AAB514_01770 [Patescibacteria group bacterium]